MKLKKETYTVLQEWPTNKRDLDCKPTPYWNFWDVISIVDEVLLKGDRIITPGNFDHRCWKFNKAVTLDTMHTMSKVNAVLARNYHTDDGLDRTV